MHGYTCMATHVNGHICIHRPYMHGHDNDNDNETPVSVGHSRNPMLDEGEVTTMATTTTPPVEAR